MTELNVRATRNRRTGVVDLHTPQHIIDHPVLGLDLELVDDDAKPFVPELISADRIEKKSDEGKDSDAKADASPSDKE